MSGETNELQESRARLIGAAHHVETRTWTALYNFLMANTILVLAWAQLFKDKDIEPPRLAAMVALSFVGWLSSVAWCVLGARNYVHIGEFGRRITVMDGALPEKVRSQVMSVSTSVSTMLDTPFTAWKIRHAFGALTTLSFQPWIVCGTPWFFGWLHATLTLVAVGFYPPAWVAIGLLVEGAVLVLCGAACWVWAPMWSPSWKAK